MKLAEAPAAVIPERLGKHRVIAKLATGGMASVYLARLVGPAGFENIVVLKRMLPHLAEDARFREMFVDEARTVAKIRHPNVVRTFELVQEHGDLYLVMEYLEGETLQRLTNALAANGEQLSFALACFVVSEAAQGLHAAHELADEDGMPLGIVHRDVSPHNLFVTHDGNVKVIDFGIAKSVDQANQTSTGELKGKFAYMAPEQVGGRGTSRRTDIFALGVVLWELLTRKRLYQRENQMVTLRAVSDEITPPPSSIVPSVPPSLDAICARCLAKDPAERYATMAELRKDLLTEMRNLGEHDPRGELSRSMQTLFEKTIVERRGLLKRSRTSEEGASPIDVTVDEPVPSRSASQVRRAAEPTVAAPPANDQRTLKVGAIATVLFLLSGILAFYVMSRPVDAPAPTEPLAVVTPIEHDEPEVAPVEPAPPAGPRLVHVTIESDPVGALVTIGGIARGNTPLTVELPSGTEPLPLELTLEGRRPQSTLLMPDRDQSLRLSLTRAGRSGGARTEPGDDERGGFFAFE